MTKEELIEEGYFYHRELDADEIETLRLSIYYSTKAKEFYDIAKAYSTRLFCDITIKTGGVCDIRISEDEEIYLRR